MMTLGEMIEEEDKLIEAVVEVPNINGKHINEDIFTIDDFRYILDKDEVLMGSNGSPIDIPEDIEEPINWIENNMDEQPDEPIIGQFIADLATKEPEVLPSYMDFDTWKYKQPEYVEFRAKMMIEENELYTLMNKIYQDEVVVPYRKKLREWYMKRKNSFPVTNHIEVDGVMFNTDEVNITNDKINNAIKKDIETNGTKDTSTEGSGSN